MAVEAEAAPGAIAMPAAVAAASGRVAGTARPDRVASEAQITELDSGVRVVTEAVPSVRSVALGLWVRTGSRDETPAQAGVSHFLEHLLFKGTKRYSAIEIAEVFDGLGAAVNAATGKESTNLYARFLDTHTDEAFDLLAEMLLRPTYPEIDSEREVVLEEIAMYEDEPQDKVHDVLDRAVFGGHPLGRRVLGEAGVISSIPIPDIDAYHRAHYTGANIVVAAAGNIEHEQIVELSKRHVEPPAAERNGSPPKAPQAGGAQVAFQQKDTEQFHICFGGPGIDRSDERRYALSILDAVFGGSTSSRLFREVREKRGLAYSVGSYTQQYVDSGMVGLYVGTRQDNVQEACEIIGRELGSVHADGITDDELTRAKEHVKGRMVLSSESTAARMGRIGKSLLFGLPLLTLDQLIEKVDAVTSEDVAELARELYAPDSLSAAAIAPDEDRFRSALAPVSEALAA
ncbi:MAG TPA: pitrilysin family protein [Solirubrobacterales bacterium]|nr:pitrilysin family protein [Solirubrobacterales bacterium]